MSAIDPRRPRPDHPWLAAFEKAPERRFDDLVRGVALPFPYGRARPADVFDTLFGNLGTEDPLRAQLDAAVKGWIAARPADPPDFRLRYGPARYAGELVEALSLVPRLNLRATAAYLHAEVQQLRSWAADLVVDPAHDPRAELWRVLAQTQSDDTYLPDWYDLCEHAGRAVPEHYLDVALLGLLGLPGRERDLSDELLSGFAAWARHLGPEDEGEFLMQWHSLKALYPRMPNSWRTRLEPFLTINAKYPFAKWWAADVSAEKAAGKQKKKTLMRRVPSPDLVKNVESRLKSGEFARDMRGEIDKLITDRVEYAEETGDSYYAVRTACNVGKLVLKQAPDLAHDLARIAVRWGADDAYGWTLWARSLSALGHNDLAEIVFWESLRRFPYDVVSRVALADLLARTERTAEAEALQRETMRRFPDNDANRNALADLLARTKRMTEAESLYRETMRRFPEDEVCRGGLATLLIRQNRLDEVSRILAEIERIDAARARRLSAALVRAWRGEEPFPGHDDGVAFDVPVRDDAEARALDLDGRVLRADFRLGPALDLLPDTDEKVRLRNEARAEIGEALRARPNHAGAIVAALERVDDGAAAAAGRWSGLDRAFPHNYGLRLAFARTRRDAAAQRAILLDFAGRDPLTRLAGLTAGVGETDDAGRVARWLAGPVPKDDRVLSYVHATVRPLLGGEPSAEALAALARRKDADLEATIAAATRMAVNEQPPVIRV